MSHQILFVRLEVEIQVDLPDDKPLDDEKGNPTPEARKRAIEAALAFIPQQSDIYLDGEDSKPVLVFLDVSDSDVVEVRCESE